MCLNGRHEVHTSMVEWVKQQEIKKRTKREGIGLWDDISTTSPSNSPFPDPLYAQQWYLENGKRFKWESFGKPMVHNCSFMYPDEIYLRFRCI
ncbi:hypothetical protein O3M35_012432 [Rhynocoris fuscipes]|uniref:Uncharacterized protein n=1 Tax=Rhynocoris fuscipes TaxID=488301 RepID=A0AAW1CTK2_9HEMI